MRHEAAGSRLLQLQAKCSAGSAHSFLPTSHLSGICSMAGVATRGASLSAGLGAAQVMAEPKAAGLVHAAALPACAGVQSSGDGGAACVPAAESMCVSALVSWAQALLVARCAVMVLNTQIPLRVQR